MAFIKIPAKPATLGDVNAVKTPLHRMTSQITSHMALFFSRCAVWPWLCLLLIASTSLAHAQSLYRLPEEVLRPEADGLALSYQSRSLRYINGDGWQSPWLRALGTAPREWQGHMYVEARVMEQLGLERPILQAIRSAAIQGEDSAQRLVFDIEDLPGQATLATFEHSGQVSAAHGLQINLPPLFIPWAVVPALESGLRIELASSLEDTAVRISGVSMDYRIFSLQNPSRLVIDLNIAPEQLQAAILPSPAPAPATPSPQTLAAGRLQLRPGVYYQRQQAATAVGSSVVHVLEIAPGYGEFRVVGQSSVAQPLSQLASGAFAAINASYYDTSNFQTIGLLQVDNAMLSPPSRGRASIGFNGSAKPIIDRVQTDVSVDVGGNFFQLRGLNGVGGGRISAHIGTGRSVGRPDQGAIVVANNRVLLNQVGPRTVPVGGFVIVYEPDIRELALIDAGDSARLNLDIVPEAFREVRYAVEAGPLLVADGRTAYQPSLEAFSTGTRILDGRTQQAAVGVRPDGTVLFVAADAMIARELIPLFLSLGAERAMRLDSGGSATLYAAGQVLNRSSQRRIVSAIVFVPYD